MKNKEKSGPLNKKSRFKGEKSSGKLFGVAGLAPLFSDKEEEPGAKKTAENQNIGNDDPSLNGAFNLDLRPKRVGVIKQVAVFLGVGKCMEEGALALSVHIL